MEKKLAERFKTVGFEGQTRLSSYDFSSMQVAKIKFADGSFAEFQYPLIINAPKFDEVGVFTEHCGYHIFSLGGTYIDMVEVE